MQNILKAQKVFGKLDGCLAGIVHALLAPVGWLKKDLVAKGGPVGVWNTGLRLLLVALNLRQHLQVREAISGPHTKGILAIYPRVVYRYTLPYLAMGFSRQARLEMLRGHYEFINTELSNGFFCAGIERIVGDLGAGAGRQSFFDCHGWSLSAPRG